MSSSSDFDDNSSNSDDRWTGLKSLVLDRISDVHSAGSFATFGSFENFPLPGICVEQVGPVRLPLSLDDAQSLIGMSRQAPFGKGNQTLIDETVRKTWEIDGSMVSFSNKAWHSWVDGIVRTVAENLGVAGGPDSVRAELYKMLLYEDGAMFKPHKDTEKTSGMFGTLVICLPSKHVGGAVRLIHGQKEKKFDTAELSAFNATFIAWYADVIHEVEPIRSGKRWILTYNLVNTSSGFPQSAAGLDAQIDRFCQTLAEWRRLSGGPECLCFALDHQYTDAGLKLSSLKCDDYYRARTVAESCGKASDFLVLLASLQKFVTFPNDDGGEDNVESELQLNRIVDLEGFTLRKSLGIQEDHLLQQLYESREPDNQSGGEYLGNQPADLEQFYNDTVMLIVPKASATGFLLGRGYDLGDFKDFLQRLQECFKMRNSNQYVRDLIVQTSQNHLTLDYRDDATKDLFLGPIAVAAIFIADQDLFRSAVQKVNNGFDENTFFALGELIRFQTPVVPEDHVIEAFSRIPRLYKIRRCLQAFRNGFSKNDVNRSNEHQAQYLASWVKDRTSQALKSLPKAHPQDAAALIEIANEYDEGIFEDYVKPFITRFIRESNFLNALVVEIFSFSQSSSYNKELVARLFPLVLDAAVTQFEFQKYSSASKTSSSDGYYPYSSWPNCYKEEEKGRQDASNVVGLYQELLKSDWQKASLLLSKIQLQTESLTHKELERLVVPLLGQLIHIMDLSLPDVGQFFQSVMATYIIKIVEKEPEKPMDWSQPPRNENCWQNCSDCRSLYEFLKAPGEESRRFILPEDCWHLRGSVPRECKISTDKSQEQQVLIITKTLKGWEEKHKEWQMRASKVQETFQRLPQAKLQQCLGEEYNIIMDLCMVKPPKEVCTTQNKPKKETPQRKSQAKKTAKNDSSKDATINSKQNDMEANSYNGKEEAEALESEKKEEKPKVNTSKKTAKTVASEPAKGTRTSSRQAAGPKRRVAEDKWEVKQEQKPTTKRAKATAKTDAIKEG